MEDDECFNQAFIMGSGVTVTHKVVLPDGGELLYGPTIAEVGDRGIPERVLYVHPGDEHRPATRIAIEVWDGIPVVTGVQISADRDRRAPIRVKDIKIGTLNLDSSLTYWLAEVTFRRGPDRSDRPGRRQWYAYDRVPAEERRTAVRTIERARRQLRRKITDELLAKVADTWRHAGPPRHEAVARAFDVDPRTAQRYIAAAREKGLLE